MEGLEKVSGTSVAAAGQQAGISLEDAEKKIVQSAAGSTMEIGFYLKQIRDGHLYEEKGYTNIWEYAQEELHFHKSTASRCMSLNDRFSEGGNSPKMDDRYAEYSKSQLQEMLSLTDEQIEQVTSDMTVREIRQIRKPEEDPDPQLPGQMEIGDFLDVEEMVKNEPETMPEEFPELQPVTMTLDVKELIPDNEEEQKEGVAASQPSGYCIHRPEFTCTSSEESKRTPGDGTDCIHHCCWECSEHGKGTCRIECYASAQRPEEKNMDPEERCVLAADEPEVTPETQREEKTESSAGQQADRQTDMELLRDMISREKKLLDSFMEITDLDLENEHLRQQQLKVKAYEFLLKCMEAKRWSREKI